MKLCSSWWHCDHCGGIVVVCGCGGSCVCCGFSQRAHGSNERARLLNVRVSLQFEVVHLDKTCSIAMVSQQIESISSKCE